MKTAIADKLLYHTPLGGGEFRTEVFLSEEDFESFQNGADINSLDYGLSGSDIERLSRSIALSFIEKNYRPVLFKEKSLTSSELKAIKEILGLKSNQFATVLGLDKGSFSNILSDNREMQHPTQILVMERLGLELSRPGSVKAILEEYPSELKVDLVAKEVIEKVRFAKTAA
jgi:DNA-binding transcriptional regulator YiaG